MNWKTVLRLISIDIKSSRLIRGTRLGSILENKVLTTVLYVGACICGAIVGWLIGNFYIGVPDPTLKEAIFNGALSLFVTFPTLALIYGLVFTQMSQIQRLGAKVSIQPLYWYPITWGAYPCIYNCQLDWCAINNHSFYLFKHFGGFSLSWAYSFGCLYSSRFDGQPPSGEHNH